MRPKGNQSSGGLSALDREQRRIAPQSLERIEVPGGAHKDVHDHVDVIEEKPAALRAAFLVARTRVRGLQSEAHCLHDGVGLGGRARAGHHEEVGDARQALQVEDDEVFGVFVQRGARSTDSGMR